MPRCTGIQILPGILRAVELRGTARSPRLVRAVEVPLPPPAEGESDAPALRDAFRAARVSRDPSILLLAASAFRVRSMSVPFPREEQIRKVIKSLMEEHLHGTPLENVLVAFRKIRDLEEDKSLVLMLALEKDVLGGNLSRFQAAGVDPQAVDADLAALFNWAAFTGAFPEDGAALVVELEADRAGLLLVDRGSLRALRSFRIALAPPEPAAAPPGSPPVPVDPAPAAAGPQPPASAEASGGRSVEKLAREILRSMVGEGLDVANLRAFAAGPLASSVPLLEELSRLLGTALSPLPSPPALAAAPPWAGPCLGAALKGLGFDRLGFDFRQEEHAFRRKFERVKGSAVAFAALLLLFFGLLWLGVSRRLEAEQEKHRDLAKGAVEQFKMALPHEDFPANVTIGNAARTLRDILKKKREVLTGQGADKDIPPIPSALAQWRDLAERINGAAGVKYLAVEEIRIEPRALVLKGAVDSPPALDSLLNAVRAAPAYGQAQLSEPKLEKDLYRFGITAEVPEPKKPDPKETR